MRRRIYIASSWKNADQVLELGASLRRRWNEVYLFCEHGAGHFVFDARDWKGRDLSKMTAKEMFHEEPARKAFEADKAGLDWADTVVLLLPAGRSSHLEAGYAVGQGKDLFILGPPVPGEFDVMYGFARVVCEGVPELIGALAEIPRGGLA